MTSRGPLTIYGIPESNGTYSTLIYPSPLPKLCHFLDGRTAKIKIKNFIGTPFSILAGVPQGASPSAKIFNLVIRLSPNPPPDLWHQYDSNFADDCTQIIASHKSNTEKV